MHILADEGITRAKYCFSPYGKLTLLPGREINRAVMSDVDVLLVRSVTRVDRQLLEGSRCRYVATATSGIDHIDVGYLEKQGIGLGWAKGCNAEAVVDYVFSCLAVLNRQSRFNWMKTTAGIIGCGEIGSRLAKRLLGLGIKPLIYDPFLGQEHPLADCFASFPEVLQCSLISLHTPLTMNGAWPTRYLINAQTLRQLPGDCVLINASRGAVIDNQALFASMDANPDRKIVLDAWEREPDIDPVLLAAVSIGTPHIAGYSANGKLNGTTWVHQDFCARFNLDPDLVERGPGPDKAELLLQDTGNPVADLSGLILQAYNAQSDHHAMLEALSSNANIPANFDTLRKHYPVRHEFSQFQVDTGKAGPEMRTAIQALGFNLAN